MESSLPALGAVTFAVAPDQDFTSRLAREMQLTRNHLEARSLLPTTAPNPKEISVLKKTLNELYSRVLQKKAQLNRLANTLTSEIRANTVTTQDLTSEIEGRVEELTSKLESVGRKQEMESARTESYESLKAKNTESLVREK